MMGESSTPTNLSSWFSKKFIQFAQTSSSNTLSLSMQSPGHHRTHSSPSYMSPTRSQLGPGEGEFVIGCSVCGTRAIEETCFVEHPSQTYNVDDPNSGAYARILAYYEQPLDGVVLPSTEVKNVTKAVPDFDYDRPFEAQISSREGSPAVKKVVYKEFSPPSKAPLTPLNHSEKQLIKECFFNNPTAQRFVKEEERKIVVSRRTEYLTRSSGQVKTMVKTDLTQSKGKVVNKPTPEAAGKTQTAKTNGKKEKTSKKKQDRGRKPANTGNPKSDAKYKLQINCGEDSASSSSEMVIHFEMNKNQANKLSLTPVRKENIKMRSSPGSRSGSPSNQSLKSGKNQFGSNKARSKNASPAGSPRSTPNNLAVGAKQPARAKSPNSLQPDYSLKIPNKSARSSRSASPVGEMAEPGSQVQSQRGKRASHAQSAQFQSLQRQQSFQQQV
jgi:hypothetical protein